MPVSNALIVDSNYTMTDGCSVTCSGEYGIVSVKVQGNGQDWDVVLDTAEARQLIFDLHRAVMVALTEWATL